MDTNADKEGKRNRLSSLLTRPRSLKIGDEVVVKNEPRHVSRSVKSCLRVKTQAESLSSRTLPTYVRDSSVISSSSSMEDDENNTEIVRSIRFEKLEVRDYPLVLGDNPSITSGPPITIDWEPASSYEISVEEYERTRPPRRQKRNMIIPKSVRQDWLRDEGYSRGEMNEAEKSALKAQKNRNVTARKRLALHVLEEKSEAIGRNLKRLLSWKTKPSLYEEWKRVELLQQSATTA